MRLSIDARKFHQLARGQRIDLELQFSDGLGNTGKRAQLQAVVLHD